MKSVCNLFSQPSISKATRIDHELLGKLNLVKLHVHTHIPRQDDTPTSRGFEESEEVDPEKSQLVCSDSYTSQPQKFSKKKKKK